MKPLFLIENYLTFILLVLLLGLSCTNDAPVIRKTVVNNEIQYEIISNDSALLHFGLSVDGKITYIVNPIPENRYQLLTFYDDGSVKSKEILTDGKQLDGRAYYFFKKYGALSADYYYENDVPIGSALEYHGGTDRIKKEILHDRNGKIIYLAEYDIQGILIMEEGYRKSDDEIQ